MTNPFQDSFHNPPYASYKWLDAGYLDSVSFAQGGPIKASSQTSAAPTAKMFLKVAKPIRLVYEQNGNRYHLTLGAEENELPLDVILNAVHFYSLSYASGGLFDPPETLEEIEITLKMRVKNYTIKKIETE